MEARERAVMCKQEADQALAVFFLRRISWRGMRVYGPGGRSVFSGIDELFLSTIKIHS